MIRFLYFTVIILISIIKIFYKLIKLPYNLNHRKTKKPAESRWLRD
jgi:hypothetical protein